MSKPAAFWDSSALTPLFVDEPGSPWAGSLAREFSPVVWWATAVEILSAIARLRRTGKLDELGRLSALDHLRAMRSVWDEVAPSDTVRDQTEQLLDLYPLRAADGLQLAAALVWCRNRPRGRTFITADARLAQAATQAGFSVLSP